jgi:hypothetical protein
MEKAGYGDGVSLFLRYEYKSDTHCWVMLMVPADGGAVEVGRMELDINILRSHIEQGETFLTLFDAGVLVKS